MDLSEEAKLEESVTDKTSLSKTEFLACVSDWMFALFVFFFLFYSLSSLLHYCGDNLKSVMSRAIVQFGGLFVMIFGIIWCVTFSVQSTTDFLKNSFPENLD